MSKDYAELKSKHEFSQNNHNGEIFHLWGGRREKEREKERKNKKIPLCAAQKLSPLDRRTDRPTNRLTDDRPMDRPTDTVTYRVA